MPTTFSKLRFIDERSKYLAYGYIKNIENTLNSNSQNIPIAIKNLCLLYYYETEEFGKHSKTLIISSSRSNKQNDIVEVQQNNCSWICVYGKIIIEAKCNPYSIYKWTFKCKNDYIDRCADARAPSIGIVSINQNDKPTDIYCFTKRYDHFAWDFASEALRNNNIEFGSKQYSASKLFSYGDTIKMEFNIKNKSLRYYLNDEDIGVAFDNINTDHEYCLAISLYHDRDQIQLVDFQNETHK
eukprot:465481_1